MDALRTLLIALLVGGAWPVVAGDIGGTLFEDPNRNGEMDAGEAPLAGLPVAIVGDDGAVLASTTSGADGVFLFSGLADGDYVVSVPPIRGLKPSLPLRLAVPPPMEDRPFGKPRYSAPQNLARNLFRAGGSGFRHVGLGDSIGFGFSVCGSLLGENGYYEPTTGRLRGVTAGVVEDDKQAIPGDETSDLLTPGFSFPLGYNDVFYTVGVRAPLISISIGGNDFLGAEDGGDAELAEAIVAARKNLQEILSSLVSELPLSDIEIFTVYDNLEGDDALHNVWHPIWNQVLREVAWGQERQVTVGEVHPEYAHRFEGEKLGQGGLVCFDLLGLDGIHPTVPGYDVHEEKLWQAFGGVTLVDGSDRLDMGLGFLPVRRAQPGTTATDVAGGVVDPDAAREPDDVGALVPSDGGELRVSDFGLDTEPPADLDHVLVKVRYRTTAAPLDDTYVFEASIDGSFSPPGLEPTSWNTIVPLVGSAGNGDAELLAYPDQPEYRTVSASLYLGAPIDSEGTLTWPDLESLTVRVVTTAVGDADAYEIEWDGAWVELYASPTADLESPGADSRRAGLLRRLPSQPERVRAEVLAGLSLDPAAVDLAGLLATVCRPQDERLLARLLESPLPLVRAHAVLALGCLAKPAREDLLRTALGDEAPAVRREVARSSSRGAPGTNLPAQLARDSDPTVRRAAVAAIGRAEGTRQVLRELLADESDAAVRVEVAAALLEQGDSAGMSVLFEALVSPGGSHRARRVLATHAIADPEVIRFLWDTDPVRRGWAAWVLGRSGELEPGVLARLRELLDDGSTEVRRAAMEALSRRGDRASLARLLELADEPSFGVDSARALSRFRDPSAWRALERLALSAELQPVARSIAARSLALALPVTESTLLGSLLESPDPRVRRIAEAGLERLRVDRTERRVERRR